MTLDSNTDLAYLSAADTLAAFRSKELSPVEYLEALIERVEACEPHLNAVADRRYDEARAEARASADRYAGDGSTARPLEGVAVAIKEEQPMRGRTWTFGSLAFADGVADFDHPIVERIQAAGGIVHVRTKTPELSCAVYCHSQAWGITRNPWNTAYSPGGSSGGSGVALAAGYAPLATGSDIGGSIRIPASLCGVVGLKPAFGRVPSSPPFNLDQYCHDGPLARVVADCALLEDVIAGRHRVDQVSIADPPTVSGTAPDARGLRVAVCLQLGDFPLDAAVRANTLAAAASLTEAGAEVDEIELPWSMQRIVDVANAHYSGFLVPSMRRTLEGLEHHCCDYTLDFMRIAGAPAMSFEEGFEAEGQMWEPLGELFERVDVLLCPTMANEGHLAGEPYLDGIDIDGVHLEAPYIGEMTVPFNIFSRPPVISVPSGRATNGVPTGVQVVARPYDDVTAFRAAGALEQAMGQRGVGFMSPDWRPSIG